MWKSPLDGHNGFPLPNGCDKSTNTVFPINVSHFYHFCTAGNTATCPFMLSFTYIYSKRRANFQNCLIITEKHPAEKDSPPAEGRLSGVLCFAAMRSRFPVSHICLSGTIFSFPHRNKPTGVCCRFYTLLYGSFHTVYWRISTNPTLNVDMVHFKKALRT